ncbi:hypothetical protein AB0M86_29385 [Streptomyces sp. NPDC051639]|uniref:hypothetical protein n=1 Tax=Streptomyces sp. NPDC051639 TaxID=3155671 RepID=UPI0034327B61
MLELHDAHQAMAVDGDDGEEIAVAGPQLLASDVLGVDDGREAGQRVRTDESVRLPLAQT